MIDGKRVLATVCARGGSKGVPRKALRVLEGETLLARTVRCARECRVVDDLVVDTDDPEIARAAFALGLEPPELRPAHLATDSAPKIGAIEHATIMAERLRLVQYDFVADLDVGAALRTPEDVEGCLRVLVADATLDAAVTAYPAERNPYFNMVELDHGRARLVKSPETPVYARQKAPPVFSLSGSVFAWRRDRFHVTHLFHGNWGVHVVPRERGVDIDTMEDLDYVTYLLARAAQREHPMEASR